MKTEQEVSQAAIDWVNDTDVTLDPEMTAIYAFIAGAQFAAPKWVSVTEKMPIESTFSFEFSIAVWITDGIKIDKGYFDHEDKMWQNIHGDVNTNNITHWMEIYTPELPTNDQKSEL